MNIPKEAIKLAVQGGWNSSSNSVDEAVRGDISKLYDTELAYIALDPTFWASLGKALGWELGMDETHAHRFYDLILRGKDTTAFWKELLTNQ